MTVTFSTRIGPGYVTTPTFRAHTFWAGEQHIEVINDNDGKGSLTEMARIDGADGNDLISLAMWADAAHQRNARTILVMPYLPGARQDHADALPFGAKVYADLINSMTLDQVICLDPHSPVMPSLIDNISVLTSEHIVRKNIVGRADSDTAAQRYQGIIAPDKGAVARATAVANACHIPVYLAEKHRDPVTRQLSGFSCEPLPETGRFLVVDDICDGGGTFMGLASATGLPAERLGLYVSHGVYTDRAAELVNYFGEIWTTNSYAADPRPTGMADDDTRAAAFRTIDVDAYLTRAIAAPEPHLAEA
ncbi:ribose-phosphate pyrophosphokinase [Frondihabitans sp. 4ASC-45]|uniref:ribose-phosphate pyrophosphokinase n=1 Tax=Frondihabitans sp. 4ASC-45 TaxID=3111636 RepID=UPI003C144C08